MPECLTCSRRHLTPPYGGGESGRTVLVESVLPAKAFPAYSVNTSTEDQASPRR